jgi:hypothetical protein
MSQERDAIERAQGKDTKGHFGEKAVRARQTENSNVLDLGGGVKATFRQAKNHANRGTQGTWSVNISTPKGSQEFHDLNVLETRIVQLHDRGLTDMAEKFEKVYDGLKDRNNKSAPLRAKKATVAA